jgi:hypothetical protein
MSLLSILPAFSESHLPSYATRERTIKTGNEKSA